jgi:hypothetical protein
LERRRPAVGFVSPGPGRIARQHHHGHVTILRSLRAGPGEPLTEIGRPRMAADPPREPLPPEPGQPAAHLCKRLADGSFVEASRSTRPNIALGFGWWSAT